jgi:hypothetical protein
MLVSRYLPGSRLSVRSDENRMHRFLNRLMNMGTTSLVIARSEVPGEAAVNKQITAPRFCRGCTPCNLAWKTLAIGHCIDQYRWAQYDALDLETGCSSGRRSCVRQNFVLFERPIHHRVGQRTSALETVEWNTNKRLGASCTCRSGRSFGLPLTHRLQA